MKCKTCDMELLGYREKQCYPYESGYYCPQCRRRWSDLQISRARHWYDEAHKTEVGADGIIFPN